MTTNKKATMIASGMTRPREIVVYKLRRMNTGHRVGVSR
jgi:hypothetical protein